MNKKKVILINILYILIVFIIGYLIFAAKDVGL